MCVYVYVGSSIILSSIILYISRTFTKRTYLKWYQSVLLLRQWWNFIFPVEEVASNGWRREVWGNF